MDNVAMTQPSGSPKRRSKYSPPSEVGQTDLRAILQLSDRGNLEPRQFSFLDKGSGEGARPLPIWYSGEFDLLSRPSIAVIGTRQVSEEGAKRASRFARELAERNIVVVSGLAAGVDAVALSSAMRNGGKVIGVIGTPIDRAYPAQNSELQHEIYESHLLISQFAIGERTFPSSFPARNRTMAAISDASVIIEAGETSGTLHQAAECVRLGRWLAISKSVFSDVRLSWPARFESYDRLIVLENTDDLLRRVYG